jgi:ubiquinone/menaquinone biosynthesis C-methylase UbiE
LGEDADNASFIGAMHAISVAFADPVVASMGKLSFKHLLDVGGASGTWTIAFLKAVPEARATIVDLPHAIDQARGRFRRTPFESRVTLVEGSFFEGELPKGADFAWVSAIAHMFNREENRLLYRRVGEALDPKGRIAIRDIVMHDSRVAPVQGALFAINMLANTPTGGTFTFEEYAEDLRQSGFVSPELKVSTDDMNSIVWAIKK